MLGFFFISNITLWRIFYLFLKSLEDSDCLQVELQFDLTWIQAFDDQFILLYLSRVFKNLVRYALEVADKRVLFCVRLFILHLGLFDFHFNLVDNLFKLGLIPLICS